jgi:hypothetical protein
VGTLLLSVLYHLPNRTAGLTGCHLVILHYQKNAAKLQQLFQAFREKDVIHGRRARNCLSEARERKRKGIEGDLLPRDMKSPPTPL